MAAKKTVLVSESDYYAVAKSYDTIDLPGLQREMKRHCYDYMEPLGEGKSMALEFCSKILLEIEPKFRKIKKGMSAETWIFYFADKDENGQKHAIFVSPFRGENAELKAAYGSHYMSLSLKEAALISHDTHARLVIKAANQDNERQFLLTPLAASCFSCYDIEEMATLLEMSNADVTVTINQSTQRGGEILKYGDVDFVICALNFSTQNIKNENIRKSIKAKIVNQYIAQNKKPNMERVAKISKFATGGIPAEFCVENLFKMFDEAQAQARLDRISKAVSQLVVDSQSQELTSLPKEDQQEGASSKD